MEYFTLAINSKKETAKSIAVRQDNSKTLIDIEKIPNKDEAKREYYSEKEIRPLFHKPLNQNIRIYIAGQSGCGKSTLIAEIVKIYHKIYNKQKIYLFTTLDYDECYDDDADIKKLMKKDKFVRYLLNQENAELLSAIEESDLAHSFCIFDDFLLFEKKLKNIVDTLKDILQKRGRHNDIDLMIVNDKVLGGLKTMTELNQSNYIIVFPFCTNFKELKTLYEKYLGFDKEQIRKIRSLETRWLLFNKVYPKYVVYKNGVVLLS